MELSNYIYRDIIYEIFRYLDLSSISKCSKSCKLWYEISKIRIVDIIKNSNSAFALFYTPWCRHCKYMMPEWEKLMAKHKYNPVVKVMKVNCDENKDLAKRCDVYVFPTIYFLPYSFSDPYNKIEYKGKRFFDSFHSFVSQYLR